MVRWWQDTGFSRFSSILGLFDLIVLAIDSGVELWRIMREDYHWGTFVRHADEPGMNAKEIRQGLEVIAESDPDFEIGRFSASVVGMAQIYHECLAQGETEPARPFVSDGVYERLLFELQERQWQTGGDAAGVIIDSAKPLQVVASKNRDHAFDTITLLLIGTKGLEPYREVWTMLRRRGAKTRPDEIGLAKGQCPNCGHDIRKTQWDRCPACESLLRSGEHDWVLSVVTQWEHYRPQKARRVDSAMRYWIQHDPGFSSHSLRDRASVIFSRKGIADRTGQVTPLKKVGSREFCDTYRQRLTPDAKVGRSFYTKVQILSVEIKGVIQSEPMDMALVAVRWTGKKALEQKGEVEVPQPPRRRSFYSLLVLHRKAGTRSRIERAISSSHCPQCGAPETELGSHACDYCHVPLNDGKLDWVLADILPYTSTRSLHLRKMANEGVQTTAVIVDFPLEEGRSEKRVITSDILPEIDSDALEGIEINGQAPLAIVRPSDRHLLHLLLLCVPVNQRQAKPVITLLRRVAELCGIEEPQFREMVAKFDPDRQPQLPTNTPQYCRRWIALVAEAALSDGKIAPWQEEILARMGKELKFSRYDVNQEVQSVIRRLEYQRSLGTEASLLAWVVRTVVANGEVNPQERATLQETAANHGICAAKVNEMIGQAQNHELPLPDPAQSQTANACLSLMIDHAIADGEICEAEEKVIRTFGRRIGLTDFEIDHRIRKSRSQAYQAAREAAQTRSTLESPRAAD